MLSMQVDRSRDMRHLYALIVRSVDRSDLVRASERCLHFRLRCSGTGLEEIAILSCSGCSRCDATRDLVSIALLIVGYPATQ
jgi:hypothetical protein